MTRAIERNGAWENGDGAEFPDSKYLQAKLIYRRNPEKKKKSHYTSDIVFDEVWKCEVIYRFE